MHERIATWGANVQAKFDVDILLAQSAKGDGTRMIHGWLSMSVIDRVRGAAEHLPMTGVEGDF
jgi:hypothetical protein